MTVTIEVPRDLLSAALDLSTKARKELRALLAAPVVERQPVPFIIGNRYSTQLGEIVRFVRVHNEGTSYETMEDEQGVNRYTRRDFGRVTGSPHDYSDPRNTPPLYACLDKVKELNYQGHASDCSTNNRGVPELLGRCDCDLSKKTP